MNIIWGGAAIGAVAAAVLVWSQSGGVQAAGVLPYQDDVAVTRGAEVYQDYCASCHGDKLQGEANWRERDAEGYLPAPPHDATGHTWHHGDAQLLATTRKGTEALVGGGYHSRMQGYEDVLSKQDILAVLAFIKSTWPPEVIERHNEINAQVDG